MHLVSAGSSVHYLGDNNVSRCKNEGSKHPGGDNLVVIPEKIACTWTVRTEHFMQSDQW